MEHQVHVRLRAARVVLDVALGLRVEDVPLVAGDVVVQLELGPVQKLQVQLAAVVGPGAELEVAALDVEGEVSDVDGAGRLEDGLRDPHHVSCVGQHAQGVSQLAKPGVGASQDGREKTMCKKKKKKGSWVSRQGPAFVGW